MAALSEEDRQDIISTMWMKLAMSYTFTHSKQLLFNLGDVEEVISENRG